MAKRGKTKSVQAQLAKATVVAMRSSGLGSMMSELLGEAPAKKRRAARPAALFQPDLDLALCIGPEPDTIRGMAEALTSDLEEMRWDGGSRAHDSKLIPELEALVDEAGDPYAVPVEALERLVRQHASPLGSQRALSSLEAIEAYAD